MYKNYNKGYFIFNVDIFCRLQAKSIFCLGLNGISSAPSEYLYIHTIIYIFDISIYFQHLESSGSSGERQNSMNQSVDESNVTTINLQSNIGPSLQVPRPSRTSLGRAQSAGESVGNLNQSNDQDMAKSPLSSIDDPNGRRSITPTKRNRFLKRQDCLEQKGGDGELDLSITPTLGKSSPCSPLMLGSSLSSPYPSLGSPPPAHDNPPVTHDGPLNNSGCPPTLTKQRSAERNIEPMMSLESIPPDPFHNDNLPTAPPPALPPPPIAHKLPAVRVISDALDPLSLDVTGSSLESVSSALTTPPNNNLNYGLLHANFRSRSIDQNHPPFNVDHLSPPSQPRPSPRSQTSQMMMGGGPIATTTATVAPPSSQSPHDFSVGTSTPPMPHPPNATPTTSGASSLYSTNAVSTEQFGHCPKERDGPALGCNYCWNTTDVNGRILRRKTKYHCPDCQANLCIVPCFQAYHEALDKDKPDQKC